MTSFWSLVWSSTQPVIKLLLLSSIGAIMARYNILDYKGRKTLSSLCWLVFLPALNFTSIAPFASQLLAWWPLIVNLLISLCMSSALGFMNVKAIRTDEGFRGPVIASITFGNVGNLPLVIVSTLASSSSSVLRGMDKDKAEALAVAYISIGCVLPTLVLPVIGYRLLAKRESKKAEADRIDAENGAENQQLLVAANIRGRSDQQDAAGSLVGGTRDNGANEREAICHGVNVVNEKEIEGQMDVGSNGSKSPADLANTPLQPPTPLLSMSNGTSEVAIEADLNVKEGGRVSITIQPSSSFSLSPPSPSLSPLSVGYRSSKNHGSHSSSFTWMLSRYSPEFMSMRRPAGPSSLPLAHPPHPPPVPPPEAYDHNQHDSSTSYEVPTSPAIGAVKDRVNDENGTIPFHSQPSFVATQRLPPPLVFGILSKSVTEYTQ